MNCNVDHSKLTKNFCTQCGTKILPAGSNNPAEYNFREPQYTPSQQTNFVEFNSGQNLVQPTNGLAVSGFVLSIIGCGFPIGLILSSIALGQFKKNPNQKGKGLAIAGVVLGSISIFFVFIYLFAAAAGL
jgi:thiol:disulfide interchange protein